MKYRYKRRPYRHQVDALKDLLSRDYGGALLMEPRTGKTKVAVDYASVQHMRGAVNRVLIFAPLGVLGVWEEEIEANCPCKHRTLVWDRKTRKTEELPAFGQDVLDFVLVNYDAAASPGKIVGKGPDGETLRSKTRGGRYDLKMALLRWQPQLIILDESHRIKTPSARKTTLIWSLGRVAPYRIIATGTAITKKKRAIDLYSQWKFLNPDAVAGYTAASWKATFGVWRSRGKYDQFVRSANLPLLRSIIHPDSFAVTRDECFDLPKSRDQVVPVELTGQCAEIYDRLAEDMIVRLKNGEITQAQLKIVLNLRLCQLTGGLLQTEASPSHPKGRLVRVGDDKMRVLRSRLEDLFEADEKVVVVARFRADLAMIQRMGLKMKIPTFELHGGISRAGRDEARNKFRDISGSGLMVVQPQVASLGIDLRTAAIGIWYSLTESYVDYTQTKDRTALSERATVWEHLLCRGTVDELKYKMLQEDGDVVKHVQASPDRLRRGYLQ